MAKVCSHITALHAPLYPATEYKSPPVNEPISFLIMCSKE